MEVIGINLRWLSTLLPTWDHALMVPIQTSPTYVRVGCEFTPHFQILTPNASSLTIVKIFIIQ